MCCQFKAGNRAAGGPRWRSEMWKPRRGHILLVPGDSPVGYRLPLAGLPHIPPAQYPYSYPADTAIPLAPLPDFHAGLDARRAEVQAEIDRLARETAEQAAMQPPVSPGHDQHGDLRADAGSRQRIVPQDGVDEGVNPAPARCAPPSPSSRATAGCACSCRPANGSRVCRTCWPRPR